MRKRKIQSITLKLGELKEYDAVKQERQQNKEKSSGEPAPTPTAPIPIVKVGPKTKQEIRQRIGISD